MVFKFVIWKTRKVWEARQPAGNVPISSNARTYSNILQYFAKKIQKGYSSKSISKHRQNMPKCNTFECLTTTTATTKTTKNAFFVLMMWWFSPWPERLVCLVTAPLGPSGAPLSTTQVVHFADGACGAKVGLGAGTTTGEPFFLGGLLVFFYSLYFWIPTRRTQWFFSGETWWSMKHVG